MTIELVTGDAVATLDGRAGGRLTSLRVGDLELLPLDGGSPLLGRCFPMVPWAGRIRHGRFSFQGVDVELPLNLAPHAIHGTGFDSVWEEVDGRRLRFEFEPPWPYAGTVEQWAELETDQLTLHMAVMAREAMPITAGWHPWFPRRRKRPGAAAASEVELHFSASRMYELDDESIPTGRLVPPPPGPWDNCFVDLEAPPRLLWPEVVELELTSSCDHWVVYDRPEDTVCVEPQSGPPDAFNRQPTVLAAGDRLELDFTMRWSLLS